MQDHQAGLKGIGVRTIFHLQFITTPTSDTPGTSLILHFDSKRYIFGEIAEGTQRACIQRGIGLRKVRGLFLSGKTTWSNGGLLGLILSLADIQQGEVESDGLNNMKRPNLHIHAGPKQMHSLACARRFVFRTGMPLSVQEVDAERHRRDPNPDPIYTDDNIRVWALCLQPASDTISLSTSAKNLDQSDFGLGHNLKAGSVNDSQMERHQTLRRDVVNNMFDSDWRRDQLVQSKLKDIKLPALVWVRDPETKQLTSYTCFDLNNTAPLTPNTDVLVRNPWPASTVEELPPASGLPEGVSMSYIVKGFAQRGSFDPKKATDLGLKPGPDFSKLVAGQTVETDNKRTITPEMVMTPTRPARGVGIFDVPSIHHLQDLERQLVNGGEQVLEGVQTVVWMTRGGVLYEPQFKQLLQRLKGMKHIISDPDVCHDYVVHDSTALSSLRLSNIASEFFSPPRYDNLHGYYPRSPSDTQDLQALFQTKDNDIDVVPANRGLKIHIEPNFLLDDGEVPKNQELNELHLPLEPAVQQHLPADMSLYHKADRATVSTLDLAEPEIVTLGTGSAAPSKYRNVSAVLLRMPDGMGNYLFDSGEGTLGQLRRLYPAEQLDDILYNLKGIWISHLHADHHLGTVAVLKAAHEVRQKLSEHGRPRPSAPCLISEVNMIDYLDEYQSVIGIPTESLCTPIACHWLDGMSHRGKGFDFSQSDVPIQELRTVKVNHCHGAQAVSVTFQNGFKFSYSGDCRPNERFCEIGENSDVLVHEATFDDGMEGDAMAKKHCTTGEAVGVALKMKAKNLILTHFSQRYQKIPVLSSVKMPEHVPEEELIDDVDAEIANADVNVSMTTTVADGDKPAAAPAAVTGPSTSSSSAWIEPDAARDLNIGIAFDLMRVKVSQIKTMKALFPAISKMFEIEEEKREKQRLEIAAALKEEQERKKLERAKAQKEKKLKLKLKETASKEMQQQQQKQKGAADQEPTKRNKGKNKRKLEPQDQQRLSSTSTSADVPANGPGPDAACENGERPKSILDAKTSSDDRLNAKPAQHPPQDPPQVQSRTEDDNNNNNNDRDSKDSRDNDKDNGKDPRHDSVMFAADADLEPSSPKRKKCKTRPAPA